MPEESIEVIPIKTRYLCDNCKKDYLISTGIALMTSPIKYEHKCPQCNTKVNLLKNYPCIEFKNKFQLIGW